MIVAIFLLLFSAGVIAAGLGYVRAARRMRGFRTTPGRVVGREIATIGTLGGRPEGRWGQGGSSTPKVTFTYTVDGRAYSSDRLSYASKGFKETVAHQRLAAIPDDVVVHYNPADPAEAYLEKHKPGLGYAIVTGGVVLLLIALVILLGG